MSSYRQIFKSTALVGGAQIVTLVISLARTKVLALWLGTAGIGLAGLYSTGVSLIGVVTGLGIGSSGVRQIAESSSLGDQEKLARTVRTLRITALLSSLLGMLIVIVFARQLSMATFGSGPREHLIGFAIVGVSLLFTGVSAGQIALLQGLRLLREMAAAQIVGTLVGSAGAVIVVYCLRERGIAWYILAASVGSALASWWYARRVKTAKVNLTVRQFSAEARGLLGMGIAFMTANLVAAGTAWLTRVLIQRDFGLGAVGLYTATWNLSSQYVGMILGAMVADFSPRLTAVAKDNVQVNRLVNEQMELGVLLALPGVLATLTFAPWVLHLFYSSAFVDAATLVRWQVIGVFLRVVSWPLGMIFIAKGVSRTYIVIEIGMGLLNVVLLFGCMKIWGLEGAGISFALLYVAYYLVTWLLCRKISGYAGTLRGRKIVMAGSLLVTVGFLATRFLPPTWSLAGGITLTLFGSAGCYVGLRKLLQVDPWAAVMRKVGLRKA